MEKVHFSVESIYSDAFAQMGAESKRLEAIPPGCDPAREGIVRVTDRDHTNFFGVSCRSKDTGRLTRFYEVIREEFLPSSIFFLHPPEGSVLRVERSYGERTVTFAGLGYSIGTVAPDVPLPEGGFVQITKSGGVANEVTDVIRFGFIHKETMQEHPCNPKILSHLHFVRCERRDFTQSSLYVNLAGFLSIVGIENMTPFARYVYEGVVGTEDIDPNLYLKVQTQERLVGLAMRPATQLEKDALQYSYRLYKKFTSSQALVSTGSEAEGKILFTGDCKRRMDVLRSKSLRTCPKHHTYVKYVPDVVEFAEYIDKGDELLPDIRKFYFDRLCESYKVSPVALREFKVFTGASSSVRNVKVRCTETGKVRIEEPGGYTVIVEGSWIVTRKAGNGDKTLFVSLPSHISAEISRCDLGPRYIIKVQSGKVSGRALGIEPFQALVDSKVIPSKVAEFVLGDIIRYLDENYEKVSWQDSESDEVMMSRFTY